MKNGYAINAMGDVKAFEGDSVSIQTSGDRVLLIIKKPLDRQSYRIGDGLLLRFSENLVNKVVFARPIVQSYHFNDEMTIVFQIVQEVSKS